MFVVISPSPLRILCIGYVIRDNLTLVQLRHHCKEEKKTEYAYIHRETLIFINEVDLLIVSSLT